MRPGSKVSSSTFDKSAQASVSAAVSYRSPERATLSWFFAIGHKDRTALVAHFEPVSPGHGGIAGKSTSVVRADSARRQHDEVLPAERTAGLLDRAAVAEGAKIDRGEAQLIE